jgi:hypothetical protein
VSPANSTHYYFTNREARLLRDLKKTAKLSVPEKVAVVVGVFIPGILPGESLRSLVRKNLLDIHFRGQTYVLKISSGIR